MNSNLWGPPDRRAHMNHRSSSMPAGGGGGAFQMNSLGGSPMMGTGGMGMGGMGGGGTGGGIPMQSTQFRSGDGPSMSGFGPSIGSGGPYMMSGGGRMPGSPNMFGGGGGGSMASKFGNSPMGRPQSAQMMAPNFAASQFSAASPPRFNQMMPGRNNPTGYSPHPAAGKPSLPMPPARGRPASALAQSSGYMQYYPKPLSGQGMGAGAGAGGMKPFGDHHTLGKNFMAPGRSASPMMGSMGRSSMGAPMSMASRSQLGKNKHVEFHPVATRTFY